MSRSPFRPSHLNAILAAARGIRADRLTPAERAELENIHSEVRRAVAINSRLLARTGAMAPETVPMMLTPFERAPTRAAHIRVVEDDADNRVAITRLLQRLGHYVTACANGVEALEILELGPVDCIICDLRMPALGGRNLYEQVEERMPNIAGRFVFVTGDHAYPQSREFLERCGQPVAPSPTRYRSSSARSPSSCGASACLPSRFRRNSVRRCEACSPTRSTRRREGTCEGRRRDGVDEPRDRHQDVDHGTAAGDADDTPAA